jgi:hypothetical protein
MLKPRSKNAIKDTTYHFTRVGNTGSSGIRQDLSSATTINPCFMSFCRCLDIMVKGVQSCFAMTQGGREGSTFEMLVFPPVSFSFSLSHLSVPLSFSRCTEGGKERMTDGALGYRGVQG